ncbi:hypothetical protein [Pseudomonas aeruginosa]|uniref:hypothetical protein n=1 Tax=Pseudomonas aeruginosa TaxID=287 RepID=UPI00129842E5|nr:hypothetical protein [Pseudomonas aeruginosa]EKU7423092.1 hypothetical protein [Pseudomonas aeruginosa]MBX6058645.1 hypothetical protein [Pseudomonas aeruginosa]MBX6083661.1 hypothetical protein [Pseudomonas aeruginosa]MBX6259553.1 hypothetical protein [Pseudomonas aeruginosa]MCY4799144.1 hypothetical protein [Pseudomonas aeruginosa]
MILAMIAISFALIVPVFIYCSMQAHALGGEGKIASALIVLLVLLCMPWGWYFISYNSAENVSKRNIQAERAACMNSTMAFVMSQGFVRQRMKSPETADFPMITSPGVRVEYLPKEEGCKHAVLAYVDAQNSFGGTVRNRYFVIMERVKDNVWRAHDLKIQ